EADNFAIRQVIDCHNIKTVISSKIEHHAVEMTLLELEKKGIIKILWVKLDNKGNVDLDNLEELLINNPNSLVSLMHANNEIGTLLPLEKVGTLCKQHGAFFHTDTVQTVGHLPLKLKEWNINFISCGAHKFHGPKGVGFIYISNDSKITPFIHGGSQERNMRGGTENLTGIVGLSKAMEICYSHMEEHRQHIQSLKTRMIESLQKCFPDMKFNGETGSENSLYTVLNCSFPPHPDAEMLLFNLDIAGICASGGSACTSGSNQGSHVLMGIGADMKRPSVRFSFCKYNTADEIDFVVNKLVEIFGKSQK
ncbi:MAG: cysteine desulfurase family protein, partial [Bacteroidia bacterium]